MKKSYLRQFYFFFVCLLIIHFSILVVSLSSKYVPYPELVTQKVSKWVNPFFEQDWGMFSNPPKGDDFCLVRFRGVKDGKELTSSWYNVTFPLNERGMLLLSLDQRLAKYMSGITFNIQEVQKKGIRDSKKLKDQSKRAQAIKERIMRCSGYNSMILYSRHVFDNLKIQGLDKNQVKVQIKIVHERFPDFTNRNLSFFSASNRSQRSIDFDFQKLFD